jgi:DNA primase
MPRISNNTIERIKARADVLDVVSEVVQLKQRGRNFFGLCPFHEEKTPSFSVNPSLGIFHCFGCGKGGNAVTFVMEYEKIDYYEALKRLADKYAITIEWEGGDDSQKGEVALIYELHEIAAEFYHKQLKSDRGRAAREYVEKRGFGHEIIDRFRIGYAPEEWENLFRQIDRSRFTPAVLEKSGLFIRKEGNNFYDRFRHRVIFPIINLAGRTVAFGGRALDPKEEAKYLNSPETPIYFKSGIFFGLNFSKDAIQKAGNAIIVEGYTDFLRLYTNGFTNVAAGSGTALTYHHARLMRRFTNKVTLCYDGDEAGQKATERAGFLLMREGLDVHAIRLPEKDDPDSFLRDRKPEEFRNLYMSAADFMTYYIDRNAPELKTTAGKTQFVERLAEELVEIKNPVTLDLLIGEIAGRINVREEHIQAQMRYISRRRTNQTRPGNGNGSPKEVRLTTAADKAEYELLKIVLSRHADLQSVIDRHLKPEHFHHHILHPIAAKFLTYLDSGEMPAANELFNLDWDEEQRLYLARLALEAEPLQFSDDNDTLNKLTKDCIAVLLTQEIDGEILTVREKIKAAEKKGEDSAALVIQLSNLRQKRRTIEQSIIV